MNVSIGCIMHGFVFLLLLLIYFWCRLLFSYFDIRHIGQIAKHQWQNGSTWRGNNHNNNQTRFKCTWEFSSLSLYLSCLSSFGALTIFFVDKWHSIQRRWYSQIRQNIGYCVNAHELHCPFHKLTIVIYNYFKLNLSITIETLSLFLHFEYFFSMFDRILNWILHKDTQR